MPDPKKTRRVTTPKSIIWETGRNEGEHTIYNALLADWNQVPHTSSSLSCVSYFTDEPNTDPLKWPCGFLCVVAEVRAVVNTYNRLPPHLGVFLYFCIYLADHKTEEIIAMWCSKQGRQQHPSKSKICAER